MKIQDEAGNEFEETQAERERRQALDFTPTLRAVAHAERDQQALLLARAREQFLKENPDGVEKIRVRSAVTEPTWDGSRKVLLWERHPLYETGEIFLTCSPGVFEVLLTEKVRALLRSGAMQQVYSR